MPVLNGLDAVQNLTAMGLRSKFVVLTMHADVSLAVLVFRAGASAFVLKTATGDELKEAIGIAHRGGYYLSPQFPCDLVTVLAEAARRHSGVGTAVAVAAATTATAMVVGSMVHSLPPNCTTVMANGVTYQQCGGTYYQPQFSGGNTTYVVVNQP